MKWDSCGTENDGIGGIPNWNKVVWDARHVSIANGHLSNKTIKWLVRTRGFKLFDLKLRIMCWKTMAWLVDILLYPIMGGIPHQKVFVLR